MAGLYIALSPLEDETFSGIENWLRFSSEERFVFKEAISAVWLGHESAREFRPALHHETGSILFTSGRITLDLGGQHDAKGSEGGSVTSQLLHSYLEGGIDALKPVNGAAMIAVWDPRVRQLHVLTDLMGYHPVFAYQGGELRDWRVTTFPDALHHDPGVKLEPDYASMADFLSAWRASPPYTYYRNVSYLGAAQHWVLDLERGTAGCKTYWKPFEDGFHSNIDEAAEELVGALKVAISDRTRDARKGTVAFISGGADSRVLLYAANNPGSVLGINLSEYPNHETEIARSLCESAGVEFLSWLRDGDYYPRMLLKNVRWTGAMWCTEDAHYLGVSNEVQSRSPDLVMTACTTDWLFKGYGLEFAYKRFLGRNLPLRRFTDALVPGYLPNRPRPLPPAFHAEVMDRRAAVFAGVPEHLRSDAERLAAEDRRVRPTCYAASVSGQIMYRVYPYDTFLADPRVVECYGKIPARMKLNGEVWGKAAACVCRRGSTIVDSNHGWPVDASEWRKLRTFAKGWIGRRLARSSPEYPRVTGHPPSSGSWPNMGWYAANSPCLAKFWHSRPPEDRALMAGLWGSDPWRKPLAEWSSNPHELFRVATLLAHWEVLRNECSFSVA